MRDFKLIKDQAWLKKNQETVKITLQQFNVKMTKMPAISIHFLNGYIFKFISYFLNT